MKKVSSSTFKETAAAAEREEKEIKVTDVLLEHNLHFQVVEKIETGDAKISTEAASRLTYKQVAFLMFYRTNLFERLKEIKRRK